MNGNLQLARFAIKTCYPKGCDLDINQFYDSGFAPDENDAQRIYFTVVDYALIDDSKNMSMATTIVNDEE